MGDPLSQLTPGGPVLRSSAVGLRHCAPPPKARQASAWHCLYPTCWNSLPAHAWWRLLSWTWTLTRASTWLLPPDRHKMGLRAVPFGLWPVAGPPPHGAADPQPERGCGDAFAGRGSD